MKIHFKAIFVLFITVQVMHGQKFSDLEMDEIHTVYEESFTTDAYTALVLDLNSTTTQIKTSSDDKVHISYTMAFKNQKKRHIRYLLNRLRVVGNKEGNKITFTAKSKSPFYINHYAIQHNLIGELFRETDTAKVTKMITKKSLDSVIAQMNLTDAQRLHNYYIKNNIKGYTKRQKKNQKISMARMVIEIPKHVHVRGTIENSEIVFKDDFENRATINSRNSKLKFKTLGHGLNSFDVDNGYFKAEAVNGGSYNFANTKAVTIGRLNNSLLNSEFTKVELGEIGANNKIIDFNSKYFLYNFTEDFKTFKVMSEYSTLYFFQPETPYKLITKGYDSAFFHGEVETVIKPGERKEQFDKMLVVGEHLDNTANTINIQLVNGLMGLGKDTITLKPDKNP